MRDNSKSCLVLVYACVIGVSLAFVSHSGTGCASLRPRQHLQFWASSVAQQPHRSYFAGSPVAYKSNVPKLRRGWKPGRVGNCGRGRRYAVEIESVEQAIKLMTHATESVGRKHDYRMYVHDINNKMPLSLEPIAWRRHSDMPAFQDLESVLTVSFAFVDGINYC